MRETGQSRGSSQPIVRFEVKSLPQLRGLLCPKARLMGFYAPAPGRPELWALYGEIASQTPPALSASGLSGSLRPKAVKGHSCPLLRQKPVNMGRWISSQKRGPARTQVGISRIPIGALWKFSESLENEPGLRELFQSFVVLDRNSYPYLGTCISVEVDQQLNEKEFTSNEFTEQRQNIGEDLLINSVNGLLRKHSPFDISSPYPY